MDAHMIANDITVNAGNASITHQVSEVTLSVDRAALILQWILFTVVCQTIDVFGIGTNIINIYCFVKQGFKDPVNISLMVWLFHSYPSEKNWWTTLPTPVALIPLTVNGLAIADTGCLVTLLWTNICFTPAFSGADLPFVPIELQYLIGGMPHITFTRITAWITAVIAMERCLCITSPLKVKRIVTSKRVSVLNIVIYLMLLASVAPLYIVNKLAMKFVAARNKTLLGLVFTDDRDHVEKFSYAINSSLVPMSAFVVIVVSTVILVVKLRKARQWRISTTAGSQGDVVSQRNQKVAKMVVMIATLFICCFVPFSILFVGMSLEPELSLNGKYRSILIIAAGFCTILESINSSANVFIYYRMSSKYRLVLRGLFCINDSRATSDH